LYHLYHHVSHKDIHKVTWPSPDGSDSTQIDHTLIETGTAGIILYVSSYTGANCGKVVTWTGDIAVEPGGEVELPAPDEVRIPIHSLENNKHQVWTG
jgi:hypothetical protein